MKVSRLVALAGMTGCIAAVPALAGVTPPQVTASELAQPLPKPYDASANASADIDAPWWQVWDWPLELRWGRLLHGVS